MRKLLSLVSKLILWVGLSKGDKSATPEQVEVQPSFLYSKEALEDLRKVFPERRWEPHRTVEELAHNAGQQAIIDYIERRLHRAGPNQAVLNVKT